MRTIATLWGLIVAAPLLLAQNAGFENGLVGWSSIGSGSWSATSTASLVRSGSKSALLTTSSTSIGRLINPSYSITIPASGTYMVTVIGWVKASSATNLVAVGGWDGVTERKGPDVTLPVGVWVQVTHTFAAANNAVCYPKIYGRSSTGAAVSIAYDDIAIYYSSQTVPDVRSPGSAAGIMATPTGTQIPLAWTPGIDSSGGSGIAGVLVLRRTGVVATDQSVANQTRYSSTNPLVGPTSVGGWTVVYNGTQKSAFTDDPGSPGVYTYLVFMRDSAYNYSAGVWAGARIFVFNGTGLSANTPVNTRLDGLYLPATCTLSSDPASTVTIRAGAIITVQGSIVNQGNIYLRTEDAPPPQVTFAPGSVYDFNRNGTSTGSELFSLLGATWMAGSTCKVTGVTTLFPGGLNQSFADLTWDSPLQTVTDTLGTPSGATIVNGTFSLMNTGTGRVHLSSVPGPNRFRGDVSVAAGTLDAGDGANAVFDGTLAQHVTVAGGVVAGALSATMDNPSGLLLGSNLSLTTLTLLQGVVSTGTNTLTILPGGTVNRTGGHVAGFLRKHVPIGSPSMLFETGDASRYAPVGLSFETVTGPGDLTASTTPGDHPGIASSGLNPALTVNRFYSLANAGIAFDTASITLQFDPLDLDPSADPGHFVVRKYDAPLWSSTGNGARTSTSVTAEGITSFSDFAVGEGELFTITSAIVGGGSIVPAGPVTVVEGDDRGFTITPDAGNRIDSVVVDGVNVGPLGGYTFSNVGANHAIVAWCSPNTHTVSALAGPHGSITPSGPVAVNHGADLSCTMVADTGAHIDSVVVDGVNQGAVGTYTFTNVTANHTISAYFSLNVYTITATAGLHGAITPAGAVGVAYGGTQGFTIAPDTGAHIDSVVVDGVNQGTVGTYTFTNVTANHTISAYFSLNVFTVTATAGLHGTITPAGAVGVAYGGTQGFAIAPDTGAHIDSVVVDGVNHGAVGTYTFTNVTANHTIDAYFSLNVFTVTAAAGLHGTITPAGVVGVAYGGTQGFAITPDPGAHIDSVVVDGVNQGAIGTYTFTSVTANHTIDAYFSLNAFAITATSSTHGTITPTGVVGVAYGGTQGFTIAPDAGAHIDSVVVDGVNQGTVGAYAFTNVTANHTISAYFSLNAYTITATAGLHGTITPAGVVGVAYGGTQGFTIAPDAGAHIDSVVVDGVNQGTAGTYTFTNVTTNHTIDAYFSLNAFAITATAGPHGTIAPAGVVGVAYGGTQAFVITPDTGAHIDSVVVDGMNQGAIAGYTFTNVTANHAIHAYFSLNVYTITATAGPHGSITPAGTVTVAHGASQSFAVLADPGYHVDSVVVDGVDQGMISGYTFTSVVSHHTIAAYFSGGVYTITATAGGGGTISPAGSVPVSHGGSVTFTVTPDVYYHIDSVLVDGVNQGAIPGYTFSGVTSNHSISAHFTIDIFRFLSMTPDTVFNEEPLRRGRSMKPVARGKGRYPNWSNLLDETVAQGGFAPGTTESDSAGGAVIGVSHMYRGSPDPIKPRWKPIRDSAATRAWVRLTGWNFSRGIGRGFVATRSRTFQRTLGDRTGRHTGTPRGFSTFVFGSERYMHGQFRALAPKKHNNKLFAELVALKLNVAASQLGKTPPGFGDLVFSVDGHFLDGLSILEISRKADSLLTYWQGRSPELYDTLWSALRDINRAFVGPLDTIRFEQPDSFYVRGTLEVKGFVAIGDVPFLRMPLPFVPTRITPSSNAVECEDDFADDEYGDDEDEGRQPAAARLYQNYPNPFNPSTTIAFRLQEASMVTIRVYTTLGEEIGALAADEEFDEGYNTVQFNADGLASGVYFYRIDARGVEDDGLRTVQTQRMVLLK